MVPLGNKFYIAKWCSSCVISVINIGQYIGCKLARWAVAGILLSPQCRSISEMILPGEKCMLLPVLSAVLWQYVFNT